MKYVKCYRKNARSDVKVWHNWKFDERVPKGSFHELFYICYFASVQAMTFESFD